MGLELTDNESHTPVIRGRFEKTRIHTCTVCSLYMDLLRCSLLMYQ